MDGFFVAKFKKYANGEKAASSSGEEREEVEESDEEQEEEEVEESDEEEEEKEEEGEEEEEEESEEIESDNEEDKIVVPSNKGRGGSQHHMKPAQADGKQQPASQLGKHKSKYSAPKVVSQPSLPSKQDRKSALQPPGRTQNGALQKKRPREEKQRVGEKGGAAVTILPQESKKAKKHHESQPRQQEKKHKPAQPVDKQSKHHLQHGVQEEEKEKEQRQSPSQKGVQHPEERSGRKKKGDNVPPLLGQGMMPSQQIASKLQKAPKDSKPREKQLEQPHHKPKVSHGKKKKEKNAN